MNEVTQQLWAVTEHLLDTIGAQTADPDAFKAKTLELRDLLVSGSQQFSDRTGKPNKWDKIRGRAGRPRPSGRPAAGVRALLRRPHPRPAAGVMSNGGGSLPSPGGGLGILVRPGPPYSLSPVLCPLEIRR